MNSAPVQIGPYRLIAEIGHGEIGLIYRATDTLYERTVALKVLRGHVAQDLVLARHFVSAGREAMRLRHPNIVRVYDAGQADGLFYVAMDLAGGVTLESIIAQMPTAWEGAAALNVVEQVGAALDYAHRRGLVHHNLKPSNIFMAKDGRVWTSDFDGIPASAGENGHPFYYRVKAPLFLAPEQARGDDQVGAAADVYSLAAIAYRLLTGRAPVSGGNPLNLLWRIAEEPSKRADELQPTIGAAVADALAAGLAKDPAQRMAHAADLVRGLGGAPLPARATSTTGQGDPPSLPAPKGTTARSSSEAPPALVPPADQVTYPTPAWSPPVYTPPSTSVSPTYSSPTYVPPAYVPPRYAARDDEVEGKDERGGQPSISPPIVALWQRATRTARRAEPMALPALALLAVGGLAALLLIFAAMRVAGTLMARIADDDAHNAGQIIVILPTVTPTPQLVADVGGAQQVAVTVADGPVASNDANGGNGDGSSGARDHGGNNGDAPPQRASGASSVQMAVVVPATSTTEASATPQQTDTPQATDTPQPTGTPTATWTPSTTPTPTATPVPTATPTPTATATPVPTSTPTVTPTATRTPAPTVEALGGRLAYTLWDPHNDRPEIWVWDLSRRVHNPPLSNFRQPDFGPNGALVANAHGGGGFDNLVTMGQFGEGATIISAHSEDAHPHWSADGKKVVFDSALMGDRQYRLYLQDDLTLRDDRPPLMHAGFEIFGRYPIFLSDGRIAFNGCNYWLNGSTCGIHVMSTDGGQPTTATGWPGDIPTDNLGARVLFMSDRAGSWDLYSMNADGSDLLQLTNLPGVEGLATASPDGSAIAYLTNQDGVWSFYVMRPDGGNIRKVFDLPGNFGRGDYDWFYERISWGH